MDGIKRHGTLGKAKWLIFIVIAAVLIAGIRLLLQERLYREMQGMMRDNQVLSGENIKSVLRYCHIRATSNLEGLFMT